MGKTKHKKHKKHGENDEKVMEEASNPGLKMVLKAGSKNHEKHKKKKKKKDKKKEKDAARKLRHHHDKDKKPEMEEIEIDLDTLLDDVDTCALLAGLETQAPITISENVNIMNDLELENEFNDAKNLNSNLILMNKKNTNLNKTGDQGDT